MNEDIACWNDHFVKDTGERQIANSTNPKSNPTRVYSSSNKLILFNRLKLLIIKLRIYNKFLR